jgi:tartrate-resistant acid phosphatase type 5
MLKYVSTIKSSLLAVLIIVFSEGCHSTKPISNNSAEPFTFFVFGDWGVKGGGNQIPVANEMIRQSKLNNLSLIVTVGDNFYEDGVTGLDDEHWKLSYEDIYKELTKKYPWYVSLGNHDYRGNVDAQLNYHSINPNWNMPGRYYTFVRDAGKQRVRFVIIDTNPYLPSYFTNPLYKKVIAEQDTARQTRWIDSVLASSKEEWKIVLGHHPLYYSNATNPDTATLVRVMEPLFEKYKVQAYIAGHVHDIQYNIVKGRHVTHIISGSGAKSEQTAPPSDYTLYSSKEPSFTICSIQNNQLNIKFIDTTGKVLYQNIIKKQ